MHFAIYYNIVTYTYVLQMNIKEYVPRYCNLFNFIFYENRMFDKWGQKWNVGVGLSCLSLF